MKIIWTPEARATFEANIDYLLKEWGDSVTLRFLDRVDDVIGKNKGKTLTYILS